MLKIPITTVLVVLYDMQCTFVTSNLVRPLILPLKGVTNKVGLCSGRGRKWWKFLKWRKIGHLGTLSKKLHIYMLAIFQKFGRKSENNSYHLILEKYLEYFFNFTLSGDPNDARYAKIAIFRPQNGHLGTLSNKYACNFSEIW